MVLEKPLGMTDQKNPHNSLLMLMETACINQYVKKNFVLLIVLEKQKKQR
jgi:hypothetical protein